MKNVYQRIHAVMKEIGTISKRGYNDFHKYEYATEADYVHALRPLLDKHGLVVCPRILNHSMSTPDDKGNVVTNLEVEFTIVNVDKPEERVVTSVLGQGQDKGDKGTYKAMTGAKKYWAALTFFVATGDDPENEGPSPSRKPAGGKKTSKPTEPVEDF